MAGYHGTSQVVKKMYYNPLNEEDIIDRSEFATKRQDVTFEILMNTFISMEFPGYMYNQYDIDNNVQDEGYSQYVLQGNIHNTFDFLCIDGISNTTFTIQHSSMSVKSDFRPTRISGEFVGLKTSSQVKVDDPLITEETIQDIKELPQSAYLDVSLSFGEDYSADKVIQLIKKYPDVYFRWLALDTGNIYGCADGISLTSTILWDLKPEFKEKYPTFYLPSDFSGNDLKQNYLSNMKFLLDHQEFMDVVNTWHSNTTVDSLQKRYDNVKKNGIHAIGVKCSIKRNDLLKMIEQDGYQYFVIHDVKLSPLQR